MMIVFGQYCCTDSSLLCTKMFLHLLIYLVCVYVCTCIYQGMHVEIGGKCMGVSFLLPPCELGGSDSVHQSWQQVLLSTEPFCQLPHDLLFIKNILLGNALSILSFICSYIISMYVSVVTDAEWGSFNTLPHSYMQTPHNKGPRRCLVSEIRGRTL